MSVKRQDRLLSHYPLLWNTRVLWMLAVLLVCHLFFFLWGFATTSPESLSSYYSVTGVTSFGVMTFSILCSLAVIITWLVFYLRNNAFKNFYIIDKYHLIKEFFIIVLVILLSITFFESHRFGVVVGARGITSKAQLAKEVNVVNLARAFIPFSKSDYFKGNSCDSTGATDHSSSYNEGFNYFDSTHSSFDEPANIRIRHMLDDPDAFSYKNYCKTSIQLKKYKGFVPAGQWMATRDRWIDNHRKDSIRLVLDEYLALCKKYKVRNNLSSELLADRVFADSLHNVQHTISHSYYNYGLDNQETDFVHEYDLRRALDFIDECHLNENGSNDQWNIFVAELYVALCLSILLLCYRLYSRRVFLISIIGSIVWTIIFSLFGVFFDSTTSVTSFYLLLFSLFIVAATINLKNSASKTVTGVFLNWHMYMLPFIIMFIAWLISDNYADKARQHTLFTSMMMDDPFLQRRYPIGYWVYHHISLLFRLNLLFVFLYTAFIFTRLSKKWHIMPEE